jgi:hypothetical protein
MGREHWSDEQLIAHLYGVGPEDGHLSRCADCCSRLETLEARGAEVLERAQTNDVAADFLAAQRRSIYARLSERQGWLRVGRWAPVMATVALAAGAFMILEQPRAHVNPDQISDAELVRQASQMAETSMPNAVAPIEALFSE